MSNKLKDKKNTQDIYIVEEQTKLKNIIVSNEDPYEKLFSSMKEEIWYSDTFDF